jgi:hypothetical protein
VSFRLVVRPEADTDAEIVEAIRWHEKQRT